MPRLMIDKKLTYASTIMTPVVTPVPTFWEWVLIYLGLMD